MIEIYFLTNCEEASVVDIEYEVYEQMGHSRDTHMIPTVQKLNQQVVGYIIDKLDPLYALDPVEVCYSSLNSQAKIYDAY